MLRKTVQHLTQITQGIGITTMAGMMFFVFIGVTLRTLVKPILGDVEIVQLGMVVIIASGLAYTERINGHISIGLIVDKFPVKIQMVLDVIARLFNIIVTVFISYVFVQVAMKHLTTMELSTDLLNIPYYPFDILIAIGFFIWGLEALVKLIDVKKDYTSKEGSDE